MTAACAAHGDERRLAAGGVYALEGTEPCHLANVDPPTALQDLAWGNELVVRAQAEGRAELTCGSKRVRLRLAKPARLDLVLVDERVVVGKPFHVRAVPRDSAGKELEVGKWTELEWHAKGVATSKTDRSAGEFGACDACFGLHAFEATAEGEATIDARLGEAAGSLRVTAQK